MKSRIFALFQNRDISMFLSCTNFVDGATSVEESYLINTLTLTLNYLIAELYTFSIRMTQFCLSSKY